MFNRVFRADPLSVRSVLTEMRRRFRDEVCADTLGRLELVLAEIMNNIAKHGHGRQGGATASGPVLPVIHLCIMRHDSGLACAVTDDGGAVPDHCLLPRSLPQDVQNEMPEGGFGWFLIQDLTQSLCYYREGQRNFLAFSIPFPSPALPAAS